MYNNVSKLHYKMYKSGKRWLISGITTAAVVISISDFVATNKVFADEQHVEVGSNVTTSSNVNSATSASNVSSTVVSTSSSSTTDSSKSNTTNQESAQFNEISSAVQIFVDEASSAAATNSAANSYYQLAQSESKKLASNANSSDNQSVYSATSNFASLAKSTASSANSSSDLNSSSHSSSSTQNSLIADISSKIHKQMISDNPILVDSSNNQNFHYHNPQGHSNDISSIIPHYDKDGNLEYWEGYYLWEPTDDQFGNEWYHFKTTDFSTFQPYDESDPLSLNNVAVPNPNITYKGERNVEVDKNVNQNPLPWDFIFSGSTFANNSKSNGQSWYSEDQWGNKINPDARIVCFPSAGAVSYLAYSNDGKQFHPMSDHSVFDATVVGQPAGSDFRDQYIVPVNGGKQLVAYVASGIYKKIYIIKSDDGVNWSDTGKTIDMSKIPQFSNDTVESPHVTTINGTPIMFFGAQNSNDISYSYVAYLTGEFDSDGVFQPNSSSQGGLVDTGVDSYGGNFTKLDDSHQISLTWLGNWTTFSQPHMGGFTLARILNYTNNKVNSVPIEPGEIKNETVSQLSSTNALTVDSANKVSVNFSQPASQFSLNIKRDDNDQFTVSFNNGHLQINRQNQVNKNTNKTIDSILTNQRLSNVQFFVDNTSLEIYLPEEQKIYTLLSLNNTSNKPYQLTSDTDAQVQNYRFDLSQPPALLNIDEIKNNYQNEKNYLKDLLVNLSQSSNNNDRMQSISTNINNSFASIDSLFNDVNSNLQLISQNSVDARRHAYIALANNDLNLINTKLYQIKQQINNLNNSNLNGWKENDDGSWSYYDNTTGYKLTGSQTINGQHVYFNASGLQIKGTFVANPDGNWSYYDANSGERLTGSQEINGKQYYFNSDGVQIKGQAVNVNGKIMYFDDKSGQLVTNKKVTINGADYDADSNGILSTFNSSLASSSNTNASSSSSSSFNTSSAQSSAANSGSAINSNAASTADDDGYVLYALTTGSVVVSGASDSQSLASLSSGTLSLSSSVTIDSSANPPILSLNASVAANASDTFKSHVKEVDGKYYYYANGSAVANSMLVSDNGSYYYFGKDGYLTADDPVFSGASGIITNDPNNAAYSDTASSINNVDGFLTVDTWYRPKSILKDGTTWTPSTENDYRPLLSVWWPSKQVEINYLNYMAQKGLATNATFTNDASQDELNIAAKQVQANIEKQITANNGSTTWLLNIFNTFIKTQSQWNINSEEYNVNDGYQGGTLSYQNSPLAPNTNTDYRLLDRNSSQQNGTKNYTIDANTGSEFLLANDVDNSNPVVQAEDLNWLHYLMNFGSITKSNSNANFDSIRVDAADNIDADILNIASKYFRDAYQTDQSEKNANNHLSIIEGWSNNDPQYQNDNGNDQLTLDNGNLSSARSALFAKPDQRVDLSSLINYSLVNRTNDTTENAATPNYSFVRAHDAGVQDIIAQIIKDNINKNSNGLVVTSDELAQAFKIYDQDQQQTDKKYTQYNIPSAYALLLTNKDTVPRVYYGDMYTDDGQFMANKTPYFDAISTLLKGRIKYVAGGQSMNTTDFGSNHSVLTSVRYGKGADTVSDSGTSETRTSGIAVVESNNPQLQLGSTDKVVINMGAAHKNQAYRPLIESSDQGLVKYDNDSDAGQKVIYTNENGQLILDANTIKGYSNPQVSGYLSSWVPVGANDNQDIRTAPSTAKNTNGKTLNSNSALDSNVMYEGFSNFQAQPTTPDEYSNVIIAKNATLFNSWGVTYMQLPPQYRSTTDNSFVDSTVQNGYSFSDRYDLGFTNPTKYGTADQLTSAIESLHSTGIKVMADYVPDQLYSMPNKQVVSVNRTDSNGNLISGTWIKNILYDASTKGSGDDYQSKYGGEFLNQLQQMYPDLFTTKQISTGKTIDPSTKIKTWEAKYFNGTNIQGQGTGAVLSNVNGADYFTVQSDTNTGVKTTMLPKQLMGEDVTYGLTTVDGVKQYVSTSGYVAKNTFLQDDSGNWYYLDANGDFVYKPDDINDTNYYFLSNGMNLRNFVLKSPDGKLYYYQKTGGKVTASGYYYNKSKDKFIYVNSDGSLAQGLVTDGNTIRYYNDDGTQLKGGFATVNGNRYYFDGGLGALVKNSFFSNNNNWYYANANGDVLTGDQVINGQKLYFNADGTQAKGQFVTENNAVSYYDPNSGAMKQNQFFFVKNNWYHSDTDGKLTTGLQNINNQELYFNSNGTQLKGGIITIDGKMVNFDEQSGSLTKNHFFSYNGSWYYSDANGDLLTGMNNVNGQQLYFNADGTQVKGSIINLDGNMMNFDSQSGDLTKNMFFTYGNTWYYSDANGDLLTGKNTINGQQMYFNEDGSQVKGSIARDDNGNLQYYDPDSGNLIVNQDITYNKVNYHADANGILTVISADSNANSNDSSASSSAASSSASSASSSDNSSATSNGSNSTSSGSSSADSSAASSSNNSNVGSSATSGGSSGSSNTSSNASSSHANSSADSSVTSGVSSAASSDSSSANSASSGFSNASSNSSSSNSSSASNSNNASSSANSGSSNATSGGSSSASSNSASNGSSNASSNSASNNSSSSSSSNAASSNNSNSGTSNNTGTIVNTGGNSSPSTNSVTTNNVTDTVADTTNTDSISSSATVSSNSAGTSAVATSTTVSSTSSNRSAQSSATKSDSSAAAKSAAASRAHAKAVKKAKAKMDKSIKAMKAAKAALAKHQTKRALAKYQKALKTYYKHEKAYLKKNGQYSNKFYYDFNLPNKAKLAKTTFVYSSKSLNSDDKVSKLKAGTKIKIKQVVVDKQTTRFNLGQGKFINGLKSMINKTK